MQVVISVKCNIDEHAGKANAIAELKLALGSKHFAKNGKHSRKGWSGCNCSLAKFIRLLDQ